MNSIAINALNKKKFAFKNFLKLSIIINFINSNLKIHAIVCYKRIKLLKY